MAKPDWDRTCADNNPNVSISVCEDTRGGVFDFHNSTTFNLSNYYNLPLRPEHYLYGDQAEISVMGFDNITVIRRLPLPNTHEWSWLTLSTTAGLAKQGNMGAPEHDHLRIL